jgi:hypothetical protein
MLIIWRGGAGDNQGVALNHLKPGTVGTYTED